MRTRTVTVGAVVLLGAMAPQAFAGTAAPLRNRSGIVVAYDVASRSNVVVTGDSRVLVVHSLRRYRPGSRIRVYGIKWGRLGLGIKWGVRPLGIKWGIRIARNGTYSSTMARLGGTQLMSLRGTVLRRYRRGVAVSFRGAIVFLPIARTAVWLPGGTLTKAGTVGEIGSRSVFSLKVSSTGAVTVTGAKQIAAARRNASVPFAGIVTAVDATTGTLVVDATKNTANPLILTLTVPVSVDLNLFAVGNVIAGTMVPSVTGGPELYLTGISKNQTFVAADDPKTNDTAPPPVIADLTAIKLLRQDWDAAKVAGKFTQAGTGLYTAQKNQLALLERAIMRSHKSLAILKTKAFIKSVQDANLNGPAAIDVTYQGEVVLKAQALLAQLGG